MINYNDLVKIIQKFRVFCLLKYQKDIDILSSKARNERLGFGSLEEDAFAKRVFPDFKNTPIDQIAILLTSPRLVKMVLRRILNIWDKLHGEIDYDDLFVMNVLRFATPEAYDFLLKNINEIRSLESDGLQKNKHERKNELLKKWNIATEKVEWDVSAAEELLAFLFPYWNIDYFRSYKIVPQGVVHSDPTDYWARANLEDLTNVEILDQEILCALKDWVHDNNNSSVKGLPLPEALYQVHSLSSKFEQFGNFFLNGEDIRKIAHLLFGIISKKEKASSNCDSSPAFSSLWRLSLDMPIKQDEHDKWILDEICHVLPISLRFANDLYYYWKHNDRADTSDKQRNRDDLRIPIIKEAKKLFKDNPDNLIKSLDKNYIYSIYHFMILFSERSQGGSGFKPEDWKWLAKILVDAASSQPQTILPQIIMLLFKTERTLEVKKYVHEFNIERANALFNKQLTEVMKLIIQDIDFNFLDDEVQDKIQFAKLTARRWLDENKG
jgi:hypothetical protein